jgi:fatty acid desaturase
MVGSIDARSTAIPRWLNLLIAGTVALANLVLFFAVPLLLAAGHAAAGWLLLPAAVLTTIPHWALIHEAVHGHLHPRPKVNEALGHLLGVLFLAPFDALRFGHLSHHALNARAAERPEFYDPRTRSRGRAVLVFYVRLLFGIYLLELLSGLFSLLPRRLLAPIVRRVFYEGMPEAQGMAARAERTILAPARLHRIRRDALLAIALLLASAFAYGAAWPLLALALLGRGFLVSLMDNAPHYDGPLADPDQGYDMRLPKGMGVLVLNSNLHGTHHRHPNLPWTTLPAMLRAEGRVYAGSYFVIPWRQLKGPIPLEPTTSG